MITESLRRLQSSSIARGASWLLLGQGVSFFVQAAYFICLAKLLGTAEYGIYVAAAASAAILSPYSSLGSGTVFIQHVASDHAQFSVYWGNILLSTFCIGGLLTLLMFAVGPHFVHSASPFLLLFVAAGDCICQQVTNAAGQVFQAFHQMRLTAALTTSVNLVRLVMAGVLLGTVHRVIAVQWAAAALCVSVLAMLAGIMIVTTRFGLPTFSFRLFASKAHDGLIYSVSGSTTTVYNDIDKVLLGHFGMNVANGIYSVAYKIVNISNVPMTSIYSAAFPRFFQLGAGGMRSTVPLARRLVKRTSLLGIASAAGLFVFAPLLPRIVGANYAQSALALRWLCLIPLFRSFGLSAGDALAGAGNQRFRLYSQIFAAALNFGLNLYLIPRYSWWGAAWASLITDGSLGALNWGTALLLCRREEKLEQRATAFTSQ